MYTQQKLVPLQKCYFLMEMILILSTLVRNGVYCPKFDKNLPKVVAIFFVFQREEVVKGCQKRNLLISQRKDSLAQRKLSSLSLGTVALQTQAAARMIQQINPRQGNYQS